MGESHDVVCNGAVKRPATQVCHYESVSPGVNATGRLRCR